MSIDLKALKKELEGISKWPWHFDDTLRIHDDEHYWFVTVYGRTTERQGRNQKFIAKAPERIAALIDEIRELREELSQAHQRIYELTKWTRKLEREQQL